MFKGQAINEPAVVKMVWPRTCFCSALLHVSDLSSCVLILQRKRELVALINLSSCYHITVCISSSIAVPWVGLWSVIVVFPGHTHLFYHILTKPHGSPIETVPEAARVPTTVVLSVSSVRASQRNPRKLPLFAARVTKIETGWIKNIYVQEHICIPV